MLRSLSPLGCTIEVGAISQGILDADLFQKTEMLVHAILDYIDRLNLGNPIPILYLNYLDFANSAAKTNGN